MVHDGKNPIQHNMYGETRDVPCTFGRFKGASFIEVMHSLLINSDEFLFSFFQFGHNIVRQFMFVPCTTEL